MRVIVVGARGRVGDAILKGLAANQQITHVVSLTEENQTSSSVEGETSIEHRKVDLFDDLSDHFKFADAAVYAGWPISALPVGSRERQIEALSNVCQCIGVVGVRVFVYGSSVGVYSPGPPDQAVNEDWPTVEATPSSQLSQLVHGEQVVSGFEDHHPLIRVVRIRAGTVVCPSPNCSATIGRKILRWMYTSHRRRFVPDLEPYVLQCVHVGDFVRALCLALTQSVNGPFNVAADPVTSDLLAEVLAARKIRFAAQFVERILIVGSRLRFVPKAINWAELALRRQVVDTTRAERDLHWTIEHPARLIVTGWVESRASVTDRAATTGAVAIVHTSVESTPMDLGSLYIQSLAYFGDKVHEIPDDAWRSITDAGLTVWQLVASIALEQYRVALAAHGGDDATIESQLPGDPLGIAPIDGWDLASERGSLAVVAPDSPRREGDDLLQDRLDKLLPRVILNTVRGGSELGRVLGSESLVPQELIRFTGGIESSGRPTP